MRIFKKDIIQRIYPLPDGLNLTPVMSTRAVYEDINMVEIPIPYSERVGSSKLSVVKDGWIFLKSMVWTVLTYNPVRILGAIGVGLYCLSHYNSLLALYYCALIRGNTNWRLSRCAFVYRFNCSVSAGFLYFHWGATFNYLSPYFIRKKSDKDYLANPFLNNPSN